MTILSDDELKLIESILDNDGIIAFPTDTVWGLGCRVDSEAAVKRIYQLKGRALNKPLILLGKDMQSLRPYVKSFSNLAKGLIERYLPGALTLILKKSDSTPNYVTSGFDTVGVRIPANEVFQEILNNCVDTNILATTSANLSGNMAGNSKDDVLKELGNDIDYIVDDYGYKSQGLASTIVMLDNQDNITVLRQGAIKLDGVATNDK